MAKFPPAATKLLLAEAYEVEVPAGRTIYQELHVPRHAILSLVISGVARTYVTSAEGRRVTLRYSRAGAVLGLPSTIAQGAPVGVQAMSDCRMLHLPTQTFRHVAQTDVTVSWATCEELTNQIFVSAETLSSNVFGTVRSRVARHLLDLASIESHGTIVALSQQDIADSIGSVREVVARVLKDFSGAGYVKRARAGIALLDTEALAEIAHGIERRGDADPAPEGPG
jgi:CRP-like cAMP-binding protein